MDAKQLRDELAGTRKKLEDEKAAILARSAPLHGKRAKLLEKIQPLEAELRKVNAEIKAIEQPAIVEVGNQIAAIARAQGATTLKARG